MFWKRKKIIISEEKSTKRLEQEEILNSWKAKSKKNIYTYIRECIIRFGKKDESA